MLPFKYTLVIMLACSIVVLGCNGGPECNTSHLEGEWRIYRVENIADSEMARGNVQHVEYDSSIRVSPIEKNAGSYHVVGMGLDDLVFTNNCESGKVISANADIHNCQHQVIIQAMGDHEEKYDQACDVYSDKDSIYICDQPLMRGIDKHISIKFIPRGSSEYCETSGIHAGHAHGGGTGFD